MFSYIHRVFLLTCLTHSHVCSATELALHQQIMLSPTWESETGGIGALDIVLMDKEGQNVQDTAFNLGGCLEELVDLGLAQNLPSTMLVFDASPPTAYRSGLV